MVSPSSPILDLSDNDEGEHEYQGHPGDYSTRMDELFADQSEGDDEDSPSHSPQFDRMEVTKATYRERLRDVLGSETAGEDDETFDLDHPLSHENAFSDDERPTHSAPDLQQPVSPSTVPSIHSDIFNTFPTLGNSRRTCRTRRCIIRPTILSTIHDILTKPGRLPPPCTPEYESFIPPPDNVPPTIPPRTGAFSAKLRHYI